MDLLTTSPCVVAPEMDLLGEGTFLNTFLKKLGGTSLTNNKFLKKSERHGFFTLCWRSFSGLLIRRNLTAHIICRDFSIPVLINIISQSLEPNGILKHEPNYKYTLNKLLNLFTITVHRFFLLK